MGSVCMPSGDKFVSAAEQKKTSLKLKDQKILKERLARRKSMVNKKKATREESIDTDRTGDVNEDLRHKLKYTQPGSWKKSGNYK